MIFHFATGSVLKLIAFPEQEEEEPNCTQCTVDEHFHKMVILANFTQMMRKLQERKKSEYPPLGKGPDNFQFLNDLWGIFFLVKCIEILVVLKVF